MRVLFLGTSCAEPTAEDGFTSFLVEVDGKLILIDASGNPVQSILRAQRDPLSLDLVVLTHHHADHLAGYPSLIQTLSCLGRKRELIAVCSPATTAKARGLHELLDLDPPHSAFRVRFRGGFRAGTSLEIGLLKGNHSVPTSMVRIRADGQSLLYTSDTAFSLRAGRAAGGCRTLIHEATFAHSHVGEPGQEWHSSAYQAGLSAAAAGVDRLLLCHVCRRRYDGDQAAVAEARSAFPGEVILPLPFTWYTL